MFLPFYIIEVEIKPQQEGILYKAEDGCRYQRMHGSTTNLDHYERNNVNGFFRQPMDEKVRCQSVIYEEIFLYFFSRTLPVTNVERPDTGQWSALLLTRFPLLLYLCLLSTSLFVLQKARDAPMAYCVECETHGHWIRMCPRLMD